MQQQNPNSFFPNFLKQNTRFVHYQHLQINLSQNQTPLNEDSANSDESKQIGPSRAYRKVHYPPSNILARNRRYQMLKKLQKQGYFQQEQIMLKFPHLYHQYVGKYKKNFCGNRFQSISQFLQSQIVNSEYRRLIQKGYEIGRAAQKNEKIEDQEKEGDMLPEVQNKQIINNEWKQEQSPFEQKLQLISQEDLSLQEQALIDFIQEQFLEGLIPGFDYEHIDNDCALDNRKQIDEGEEQKYFNSEQGYNQQEQQVDDPQHNTNIQDF